MAHDDQSYTFQGQLLLPKMFVMMSLVFASLVCSMFPYILTKINNKWRVSNMSLKVNYFLTCLTAGIYLGLALLYFLFEARGYLTRFFHMANVNISYPILEMLVCVGFFSVSYIHVSVHEGVSTIVITITRYLMGNDAASPPNDSDSEKRRPSKQEQIHIGPPEMEKRVLLLAICCQTFLVGMVIGLQHFASEVFHLMVSVIIYVSLFSFEMGQQLFMANERQPIKAFYMAFVFGMVAPIGISIGIAISTMESNLIGLFSGIILAIATGTFLHISFIHTVQAKAQGQNFFSGFVRFFFMLLGLLLVACVRLLCDKSLMDWYRVVSGENEEMVDVEFKDYHHFNT